jgi:hypothetical protein
MGWSLSPPYFCAFTETCADLCNTVNVANPTHPYSLATQPQLQLPMHQSFHEDAIFPFNPTPPHPALAHTDVYLDDFMLLAQQPRHLPLLNRLLHHLHLVFRDQVGSPRKAIVSASKVEKGDATFSTQKRILGWDIDTHAMTLHLPLHRQEKITAIVDTTQRAKYISRKKWQRLLGELHSVVPAVHSGKYLFSALHHLLTQSNERRLRITALARDALREWTLVLRQLSHIPVPIADLVPQAPHFLAATDASKLGMGGFWIPTNLISDDTPYCWRHPWDGNIQSRLLSADNPTGDITINDFELAAIVTGHRIQHLHTHHHRYSLTCIATDNTPAQAWVQSGSPTTPTAPAFLLRLLADDCRTGNRSILPVYTAGTTNLIADFLSRSFHLNDHDLLSYMMKKFPTKKPWKLVTPTASTILAVNSALLRKLPQRAFLRLAPTPTTPLGRSGLSSATTSPAIPSYRTSQTPSHSYNYSPTDTEWERWLPPALLSKVEQWRRPFVPWGRRFPSWDSKTHGYTPLAK